MNAFNLGPVFKLLLYILSRLTQTKLFFGRVFATMIGFLQVNRLNIDKTFSCQREYTDHTLPQYLQLGCRMIVLSDSHGVLNLLVPLIKAVPDHIC